MRTETGSAISSPAAPAVNILDQPPQAQNGGDGDDAASEAAASTTMSEFVCIDAPDDCTYYTLMAAASQSIDHDLNNGHAVVDGLPACESESSAGKGASVDVPVSRPSPPWQLPVSCNSTQRLVQQTHSNDFGITCSPIATAIAPFLPRFLVSTNPTDVIPTQQSVFNGTMTCAPCSSPQQLDSQDAPVTDCAGAMPSPEDALHHACNKHPCTQETVTSSNNDMQPGSADASTIIHPLADATAPTFTPPHTPALTQTAPTATPTPTPTMPSQLVVAALGHSTAHGFMSSMVAKEVGIRGLNELMVQEHSDHSAVNTVTDVIFECGVDQVVDAALLLMARNAVNRSDKLAAVNVLVRVCIDNECGVLVDVERVVKKLLHMSARGEVATKEAAEQALWQLAYNQDTYDQVVEGAGGITKLVAMLVEVLEAAGVQPDDMICHVVYALCRLATTPSTSTADLESAGERAVGPLVQLLERHHQEIVVAGLNALKALMTSPVNVKRFMYARGHIKVTHALVRGHGQIQVSSLICLDAVASSTADDVSCEIVEALAVEEHAVAAITGLIRTHPESREPGIRLVLLAARSAAHLVQLQAGNCVLTLLADLEQEIKENRGLQDVAIRALLAVTSSVKAPVLSPQVPVPPPLVARVGRLLCHLAMAKDVPLKEKACRMEKINQVFVNLLKACTTLDHSDDAPATAGCKSHEAVGAAGGNQGITTAPAALARSGVLEVLKAQVFEDSRAYAAALEVPRLLAQDRALAQAMTSNGLLYKWVQDMHLVDMNSYVVMPLLAAIEAVVGNYPAAAQWMEEGLVAALVKVLMVRLDDRGGKKVRDIAWFRSQRITGIQQKIVSQVLSCLAAACVSSTAALAVYKASITDNLPLLDLITQVLLHRDWAAAHCAKILQQITTAGLAAGALAGDAAAPAPLLPPALNCLATVKNLEALIRRAAQYSAADTVVGAEECVEVVLHLSRSYPKELIAVRVLQDLVAVLLKEKDGGSSASCKAAVAMGVRIIKALVTSGSDRERRAVCCYLLSPLVSHMCRADLHNPEAVKLADMVAEVVVSLMNQVGLTPASAEMLRISGLLDQLIATVYSPSANLPPNLSLCTPLVGSACNAVLYKSIFVDEGSAKLFATYGGAATLFSELSSEGRALGVKLTILCGMQRLAAVDFDSFRAAAQADVHAAARSLAEVLALTGGDQVTVACRDAAVKVLIELGKAQVV